jgi:hypothetical protein
MSLKTPRQKRQEKPCRHFHPEDPERLCHHPYGWTYCYLNHPKLTCGFKQWIRSHFYPIPADEVTIPHVRPSEVII